MFGKVFVTAIVCYIYCSVSNAAVQRIPDDKSLWRIVQGNMNKSGTSRSDNNRTLSIFDQIVRVNAKSRGTGRSDGVFLFQGDIAMARQDVLKMLGGKSRGKRAAMKKTSRNLWRNPVRYHLDRKLPGRAKNVILSAIKEWEKTLPCKGKWQPVNRGYRGDHMYFFQGGGCYSQVGRKGGLQQVSIGQGCEWHGIAVHEIGHAMGLWHEQSRPDRDRYVTINWNNIIPAMKFNFQKFSQSAIDSQGQAYDYGSVMHYGSTAFARRRGLYTILRKNSSPQLRTRLGQRQGLSTSDKEQVKRLYGCTGTTTVKPTRPTVKPTRPTDCKDTPSHATWCTESEKLGLCRNSLFKGYMTTHCCSKCRKKPTPAPPACKDLNSACTGWANRGYCAARHRYAKYMKDNCCVACKKRRCAVKKDKNRNCDSWKKRGFCTGRYKKYMEANCGKACCSA